MKIQINRKRKGWLGYAGLFSLAILLLTGCATPGKHTLPENGDKTIADMYRDVSPIRQAEEDAAQASLSTIRDTIGMQQKVVHYTDSTQEALRAAHLLFKPRPNPAIPLYIYPHLSLVEDEEEIPVPGYTTAFFLYPHHSFVLPADEF